MDNDIPCPICTMTDLLDRGEQHECVTCGHEWAKEHQDDDALHITDANGKALANGDTVILIKDLKIKGKGGKLKAGTKIKGIRLVTGDHEIDCKVEGRPMLVRAAFVKLA